MLKRLFKKKIKRAHERFSKEEIILACDDANYFGMESRGVREVRGNGTLILTEEIIFFLKWVPEDIIEIPLNKIQDITTPKSHMHRSAFLKLLKVSFLNQEGNQDSVAWFVRDLDKWTKALSNYAKS
ncbi:MAG: hypothetical protein GF317_10950 [Candidatus Lokiarchaeota archaeon]|nr:hypothetical protein [Candidatus Lokiarchaeota archaeon]MBD3200180.1 hypothetical protein [Candidatus Lokiarchaeota archaeon]